MQHFVHPDGRPAGCDKGMSHIGDCVWSDDPVRQSTHERNKQRVREACERWLRPVNKPAEPVNKDADAVNTEDFVNSETGEVLTRKEYMRQYMAKRRAKVDG